MFSVLALPIVVFAAGPNGAADASGNNVCGNDNWTWSIGAATNLQSNDTSYASVDVNRWDQNDVSDQLDSLDFGFTGLSGTIAGIQVDVYGWVTTGGPANFTTVQLTTDAGSTLIGTNQAAGALSSTDDDVYDTFGGAADDWSAGLTTTDINSNASFGVSICWTAGGDNTEVNIDHVQITVTTAAASPDVTTNAATGVTVTSATLNGDITALNDGNATVRGFAYGTDSALQTTIATTTENGDFGTGTFDEVVGTLQSGVTYYFRAYATSPSGTGYGTILNFTAGTDITPTRRMRLFEGFTIKLVSNRVILYGQ